LHGITVTVVHIAATKMLHETVPVYLLGNFGPMVQGLAAIGYALTFGFGYWLPQGDYNPSLHDEQNMRAK